MDCPRCNTEMNNGICPNCGYSIINQNQDKSRRNLKNILKYSITSIAVVLFLGYLLFNIGMMLWSIELILPKTLTNKTMLFVVFPLPIGIKAIGGYWFSIYYIFLVLAIISSLITIFYKGGKDLFLYFKDLFRGKFSNIKENDRISSPFLRLVTVFTALLFITYIYMMLLELTGGSIETPSFDDMSVWERIYGLTRASVWEELVVRVAFIGLPMAVYGLVKKHKNWKNYILGGFGVKNRFGVTLIILSSIIFAAAHLPGWNIHKMIPTLIAGFAFGYLFAKDGLYSAILLHFFWDYLSVPNLMMDIPDFEVIISSMILVWMGVGLYYTYYYIKNFTAWLKGSHEKDKKKKEITKKEPRAEKTAGVGIGYVCGNCGYKKAKYTGEGKLKCKRCGTESDPKSEYSQQTSGKPLTNSGWPPS